MKHKVRINANREEVIQGGQRTMRGRLLNWLLGVKTGVHVVTIGRSVQSVEIQELSEGGTHDVTGTNKVTG